MSCTINEYKPPDIYDLIFEKENYYNYSLWEPNSIYFNIPKDISTTTLTAGYINKENCQNNLYYFTIRNYIISGEELTNIDGDFDLSLYEFENKASCVIDSTNKIIHCHVTLLQL